MINITHIWYNLKLLHAPATYQTSAELENIIPVSAIGVFPCPYGAPFETTCGYFVMYCKT